jgi:hypothetical protein
MDVDMGSGIERLQCLPIGRDELQRPDVGGFDAKPANKHFLPGQFGRPLGYLAHLLRRPRRMPQKARIFADIKRRRGKSRQFGSLMAD